MTSFPIEVSLNFALKSKFCFENKQGRTFKFFFGRRRHVLDRLTFFGPTEGIQAVRTLKKP